MFSNDFLNSDVFKWVVLPLLIFVARMSDVSLGTMRHILVARGMRQIVPFLGFLEVLIWLFAISQTMKHLDNIACYIGFASGFAMGTYVGMRIEEKLALGMQVLRIITHQDCQLLINELQNNDIGVTIMNGQGAKGPVKILLMVVNRKDLGIIINIIQRSNPGIFYSIEDVRTSQQGVFPKKNSGGFSMKDYSIRKILSQIIK
jgi:uncharacterized protein YebE (UPF0316 family)